MKPKTKTDTQKYFIFGTTVISGYKETVYLNKEGNLVQDVDKEDLLIFNSSTEAFEYTKKKGLDLGEWDKLSNF